MHASLIWIERVASEKIYEQTSKSDVTGSSNCSEVETNNIAHCLHSSSIYQKMSIKKIKGKTALKVSSHKRSMPPLVSTTNL